jgi:hypothetical protein
MTKATSGKTTGTESAKILDPDPHKINANPQPKYIHQSRHRHSQHRTSTAMLPVTVTSMFTTATSIITTALTFGFKCRVGDAFVFYLS